MIKIPTIYNLVESNVNEYNSWIPWILTYTTHDSIHPVTIKSPRNGIFKRENINSIEKFCSTVGINEESTFDAYSDLQRLFLNIKGVQVLNFHDDIQDSIDRETKFLIIGSNIQNQLDDENLNSNLNLNFDIFENEILRINGSSYELRFIGYSLMNTRNTKWVRHYIRKAWNGF